MPARLAGYLRPAARGASRLEQRAKVDHLLDAQWRSALHAKPGGLDNLRSESRLRALHAEWFGHTSETRAGAQRCPRRPRGLEDTRACTSVAGMTTHRGTAVLILEDGRELAAEANLSKDGAGSWSGTLAFPAGAKTPGLLNLTEGALRVGGREGKFVRPDTSDWIGSPAGQVRIRIEGNGDAPF